MSSWEGFEQEARRAPDARRERQYAPSVEYVAGEIAEVAIPLAEVPESEGRWREEITRVTGLTVPENRKVELAQVRYWGNPQEPNVYCRFLISDREELVSDGVDAAGILRDLRRGARRRTAKVPQGDSAFCVSWNDWQVAKLEGGGTAGLARRLQSVFDATEARIKELRKAGRTLGSLVIIGGGDMVEGCGTIFPNQAYEIDSDRRTQIRNTVTFILAGLDRLAPLFADVTVLVVGGNHGENRINGKRTTRHDNDDCAVFEHAAEAAARDPQLSHVKFLIALDEPAKTLKVGDWILGTTHGNAFRGGGHIAAKAHRWFSGMAAGRHPVGDADLLLTHHYHHFASQDWGACLWVQTPSLDGGSPHFTDGSGMAAGPGMLTWVMSPESRFADPQILIPVDPPEGF